MYVSLGTVCHVSLQKTHTELSHVNLHVTSGLSHWPPFLNLYLQKCSTKLFKTAVLIIQLIS